MRTAADWKRIGSESESADWKRGHSPRGEGCSDEELKELLGYDYHADLGNPEICEDREAALNALLEGYREGG